MHKRRLMTALGAGLVPAALVAGAVLAITPTGDPIAVTTGPRYWSAEYQRETRTVYPVYPGWAGVTGHDPVGRLIKRNGAWLPNEQLALWATDLGVTPAANPAARTPEDWTRQAGTKLGARDHRAARSARLLFVAALTAAIGLLCGVLTWVIRKPKPTTPGGARDPI